MSATIGEIFVYGTLMRQECRFPFLLPFGLERIERVSIPGKLFNLGEFPGYLPLGLTERAERSRPNLVHGELIKVRDLEDALKVLDAEEQFTGKADDSLYLRQPAMIPSGSGETLAWHYVYNQPLRHEDQRIDHGCWRTHRGVQHDFVTQLVTEHLGQTPPAVFLRTLKAVCKGQPQRFPGTDKELIDAVIANQISEHQLSRVSSNWTAASTIS